ncbi:Polyketide cyclase / dehydrase and lipid transport [Beggiatoa alba B18LD]|uniref:Polyketide cyclase / dehydrase and lipid transport n=1 Tax=Beggiatoa alba B18LD TaxID=395493 RepID=I3CBU2_9GAMM|nr:SRPBCC family protein [Beggiatoa alba]EIJ41085.1 Polyketide cyclase / dehydrase and lipid transport [Beggiatoa alba B18LD]
MKKWLAILGLVTFSMNSAVSFAADVVGTLAVKSTMMVRGTPEKVWGIIGGFNDLPKWHPAIAKSQLEISGDANSGGITSRILTLNVPDNPVIVEQLLSQDPEKMTYSYAITKTVPEVLPVQNYMSTISVVPVDKNQSQVIWEGSFSALPNTDPAKAKEIVENVYTTGLINLKGMLNTTADGKVLPERENSRVAK